MIPSLLFKFAHVAGARTRSMVGLLRFSTVTPLNFNRSFFVLFDIQIELSNDVVLLLPDLNLLELLRLLHETSSWKDNERTSHCKEF